MSDRSIRRAIAWGTAVLLAAAPFQAQAAVPHMARTEAVADQLAAAARLRTERIQLVRNTLELPQARQEAARRGVKVEALSARVASLSDDELADLARRSQNVKDVVAGHRGDSDEALVIVGVVLLVAGLVILAALGDWDDYYDDDCYCY